MLLTDCDPGPLARTEGVALGAGDGVGGMSTCASGVQAPLEVTLLSKVAELCPMVVRAKESDTAIGVAFG